MSPRSRCIFATVVPGLSLLGRIIHLMAASAKSRILYELILECRRFGEARPDGGCYVALRETDLAARAGLSRETVSREVRKLKAEDLISGSRNGMIIKDLAAIERILGSEV